MVVFDRRVCDFLCTVCGGRLIATNGVKHFYSHSNYGDLNYDSDATCEWTIEAKPNMNVHLTFLTFELEEEKDCMYDYVEVWSGLDTSGPFFGRFCGPTVSTRRREHVLTAGFYTLHVKRRVSDGIKQGSRIGKKKKIKHVPGLGSETVE